MQQPLNLEGAFESVFRKVVLQRGHGFDALQEYLEKPVSNHLYRGKSVVLSEATRNNGAQNVRYLSKELEIDACSKMDSKMDRNSISKPWPFVAGMS